MQGFSMSLAIFMLKLLRRMIGLRFNSLRNGVEDTSVEWLNFNEFSTPDHVATAISFVGTTSKQHHQFTQLICLRLLSDNSRYN
jgi:hypothetical protein